MDSITEKLTSQDDYITALATATAVRIARFISRIS